MHLQREMRAHRMKRQLVLAWSGCWSRAVLVVLRLGIPQVLMIKTMFAYILCSGSHGRWLHYFYFKNLPFSHHALE